MFRAKHDELCFLPSSKVRGIYLYNSKPSRTANTPVINAVKRAMNT